jgi:hypothetical protein
VIDIRFLVQELPLGCLLIKHVASHPLLGSLADILIGTPLIDTAPFDMSLAIVCRCTSYVKRIASKADDSA